MFGRKVFTSQQLPAFYSNLLSQLSCLSPPCPFVFDGLTLQELCPLVVGWEGGVWAKCLHNSCRHFSETSAAFPHFTGISVKSPVLRKHHPPPFILTSFFQPAQDDLTKENLASYLHQSQPNETDVNQLFLLHLVSLPPYLDGKQCLGARREQGGQTPRSGRREEDDHCSHF